MKKVWRKKNYIRYRIKGKKKIRINDQNNNIAEKCFYTRKINK